MSKPLPESVRLIADVIGEDAALDLVRRLPRAMGRREHPAGEPVLYVPKTMTPHHRLVGIVGWPAACKLSKHFGGDLMFLATCAGYHKSTRNAEILAALKEASPAAVAERFRISERQVRRVVAAARADTTPMGSAASRSEHARTYPTAAAA